PISPAKRGIGAPFSDRSGNTVWFGTPPAAAEAKFHQSSSAATDSRFTVCHFLPCKMYSLIAISILVIKHGKIYQFMIGGINVKKMYGYARVSAKDQCEARQFHALQEFGVPEHTIYLD